MTTAPRLDASAALLAEHFRDADGRAQAMIAPGRAARALGISERHLADLARRGAIGFVAVGSHRRFRLEDLLAFLGRGPVDPPAPPRRRTARAAAAGAVIGFSSLRKDSHA